MTRRPPSPRRDYLMHCAEQQLLPVPVFNAALKLEAHASGPDPLLIDGCKPMDQHPSAAKSLNCAVAGTEKGAQGCEGVGSLLLRHYYLGSARAKCLESIKSVHVALKEVSFLR